MRILETKTIYCDGEYVSFPNLAKLKDDTILCAFRHAPDRQRQEEFGSCIHHDPEAKDVYIVSHDDGETFEQELHIILDEEMISNQDPCLTVLSNGRVISTSYRWLFAPLGEGPAVWGEKRYQHCGIPFFNKYDSFIGDANCSYSDDNGKTWTLVPRLYVEGTPCGVAVRGNIVELPNGDLLMPYYNALEYGQLSSSGLFRSTDHGETWENYSLIATDPKAEKNFYEPNIILTKSGRIVALLRTQPDPKSPNPPKSCVNGYLNVHMAVSEDYGKTFGPVKEMDHFWGSNPIHALQLQSGNILVTYGYRREPYGIRARVCNSELTDLNDVEEIILRDDAPHGDLGYTNAIQLDNGDILVTYYIAQSDGTRTIELTRLRED